MSDWGPVFVAVVLFVVLSPGLLFQIPGKNRMAEFGTLHTSGASILVHSIIYFALISIFLLAVRVHIEIPKTKHGEQGGAERVRVAGVGAHLARDQRCFQDHPCSVRRSCPALGLHRALLLPRTPPSRPPSPPRDPPVVVDLLRCPHYGRRPLCLEVKAAQALTFECGKKNRLYLLLNCQ
ncbi:hypothetical protein J5N97_022097 [Dioscorea zingiberensis]|uniref:Transmembrane protein n=1 Tax=Dioscorea zingiberensis TaxID=325984 RepID=A0A9D5CB94_9LILI|nr:hypothetical protein J5N97_022097 [Dioscorea zingiberensis]